MPARYFCRNQRRAAEVRRKTNGLNGIDFLEVASEDQKSLAVHFIHPLPTGGQALSEDNVRIRGGTRFPNIAIKSVATDGKVLTVTVDSAGDSSTYRLSLVSDSKDFDPRLSAIDFSFKADCPSEFDCRTEVICPSQELSEPEIDYLAKDYASFRQTMLDRLATIAPDWRERNPADLGVALVELLAYVGDRLSYYQDAVATEAYLGTARKRISVRRHARLVDYFMHEGCNARTWAVFEVEKGSSADGATLAGPDRGTSRPGSLLLSRSGFDATLLSYDRLTDALAVEALIFETMDDVTLWAAHNEIRFYTWSDRQCCLPVGATEATLMRPPLQSEGGDALHLHEGDLLLFEEVLGPKTGVPADADPTHRQVVRLISVTESTDPLNDQAVVEIAWDPADALRFPLCISSLIDDERGTQVIENVGVARGNMVLADHGLTLRDEEGEEARMESIGVVPEDGPFRPVLQEALLTQAVPRPRNFAQAPAAKLMNYVPQQAVPAVRLTTAEDIWTPRRDLFASDRFATEFVAEMDEDGRARLRFGDDEHGMAPTVGTSFTAVYRIGNGTAGNAGAESLGHVIPTPASGAKVALDGILAVRNPLPAWGGRSPETLDEVRQFAPQAFRVQKRAVTEADYARVAELHAEVQRAAATFRWTGSWYTVFLTVDRRIGLPVDPPFERKLREHLNFFRMAGYDLEVDGAQFVALNLVVIVCVDADYFRSDVEAVLLERFSNRSLPGGGRGFFHPDNWTFDQPVYLSRIHAAASEVEGVDWVEIVSFHRWGRAVDREREEGVLPISRLEIARLDNDPNFPENGRLEFLMRGGK